MTIPPGALLFADSNVFIEDLLVASSPAALVIDLVIDGTYNIATCRSVVEDVENAIIKKAGHDSGDLGELIEQWTEMQKLNRLIIMPDPALSVIRAVYTKYISSMRHEADITVLAAAIAAKPAAILSGNWEHFNDKVAAKCGIPIYSCAEFLETLTVQ